MKFFNLIITGLLFLAGESALAAEVAIDAMRPGASKNIVVDMALPGQTSAVQLAVRLPEGFALGAGKIKLNADMAGDHQLRYNMTGDNTYKCVVYSATNTVFSKTEGSLLTVSVKADAKIQKGVYDMALNDIIASDAAGVETKLEDMVYKLSIYIPATSIELSPTSLTMRQGETAAINATVQPEEASKEVDWSSSNPEIVSVSEGVVTAMAPGSATITARTTDGTDRSARSVVTVLPPLVSSIVLDRTAAGMRIGEKTTLRATVLPENAGNRSVTWKSSDMTVATVDDNGTVTAVGLGEADITATTTDGTGLSASCRVTVTNALATAVNISETSVELRVRGQKQLSATVEPTTAAQGVDWSSSDEAVATVDASGLVTAVAPGRATVTATAVDGSGVSATCAFKVLPALVESISLDITKKEIRVMDEFRLSATVLPDYAGNKTLTWTSSDAGVATVDAAGMVKAIAVGEATITAATTDGSGLSAACYVNVDYSLINRFDFAPSNIEIKIDSVMPTSLKIFPETANQSAYTYESENSAVAEIDSDGIVLGKSEGVTFVRVLATDGSGTTAQIKVTVTEESGVAVVGQDGTSVKVIDRRIVVSGTNKPVRIFTIDGKQVIVDELNRTAPLAGGIFIVCIGSQSVKVHI